MHRLVAGRLRPEPLGLPVAYGCLGSVICSGGLARWPKLGRLLHCCGAKVYPMAVCKDRASGQGRLTVRSSGPINRFAIDVAA